jgi:hypothetical protein
VAVRRGKVVIVNHRILWTNWKAVSALEDLEL